MSSESLLEARKVSGQDLLVAEHILELIGDIHLLAFFVIKPPRMCDRPLSGTAAAATKRVSLLPLPEGESE